jgi:hypothetical protein
MPVGALPMKNWVYYRKNILLMKKVFTPLFYGVFFLFVVSCRKDTGSAGPNILSGNYNFLNVNGNSYSVTERIQGGSDMTVIAQGGFATNNNIGSLVITGDQMSFKGTDYAVAGTLAGAEYINAQFLDSLNEPSNDSFPAANTSAQYRLIGADSIYFPSGFVSSPSGSSQLPAFAVGGRFVINGRMLTITIAVPSQVSKENVPPGITETITSGGVEIINLQKQ